MTLGHCSTCTVAINCVNVYHLFTCEFWAQNYLIFTPFSHILLHVTCTNGSSKHDVCNGYHMRTNDPLVPGLCCRAVFGVDSILVLSL